jgi:hypothetical protein
MLCFDAAIKTLRQKQKTPRSFDNSGFPEGKLERLRYALPFNGAELP